MNARMFAVSLLSPLLLVTAALASQPVFQNRDGAIRGYDPVAYFNDSKPVPGERNISFEWNGAHWYFASTENRELFAANPLRYAPQYGGFCAYAMSKNQQAPIDPEAWTITDGRLYLNFSKPVKKAWVQDIPGYVSKADRFWSARVQSHSNRAGAEQ